MAAALAARQRGVVTRAQLLAAGCAPRTVARRVATGRFKALHQGVYRVGPNAPPGLAEMAASLACGPSALVSHTSAGVLWGVVPRNRRPARVHVIVVDTNRSRPGVQVHRIGSLAPDERTTIDGIPITTPARTLFDLAGHLHRRALEQAVGEAIALRLVTLGDVAAMAERHRGRKGAARLLTTVVGEHGPRRTRSTAEERFLALVQRAAVTPPRVNTQVAGYEVDFLWPDQRLVVEVDGVPYHTSLKAQARDRKRDGDLQEAGFRVLRVTWQEIVHHPEALLVRLGRMLPARPGRQQG